MCYTLSPSKNMLSSLAALGISPQHLCSSDFPEVTYSAAGLVPLNPALVPTHPSLFFFFTLLYTSHPPHPTQVLFLLAGPPRVAGALVDISSSLREESGKGEGNLPRLRYSELGESH